MSSVLKTGINKRKIINDPVHGIISIPGDFIYDLIEHPFFQRLRNIRQLGLTEYVYPGASHSRFIHSLGALHLMIMAVDTLKQKGIPISAEEEEAAMVAILLHDTGHSPFSHALEYHLVEGVSHDKISALVMKILDDEYHGRIGMAIEMFTGEYNRNFFHDLISSQIDMDRLDYLVRDSFYSGVVEGSVGSDRIIRMLNVHQDKLVVEEKGIYSIEKFLIARRLMYWQVYMHKTVVSAEKLLLNVIRRVKEMVSEGIEITSTPAVDFFIRNDHASLNLDSLNEESFRLAQTLLKLDDNEMIASIRLWSEHSDPVLSDLSKRLVSRSLFAIELGNEPFDESKVDGFTSMVVNKLKIDRDMTGYYVFTGQVSNMTYAPSEPRVQIMSRSGKLNEITEVSDMLDHKALSKEITKYFLCYPKELRNNTE
ncbi:MAG TPA: HD domain-containing protein [Bacteroidales bacterium]|nr:HD domain-containing protein [Bacteroidales bacterium]